MQQFASQRTFFEQPREITIRPDSGGIAFNRLLLLAIERALAPPVIHRRNVFHPMRIVIVDPSLLSRADDEQPAGMPAVLPRALPLMAGGGSSTTQVQQRRVRGEILSDEAGQLYEKLGRQVRPIYQLASGPSGEVIDLVPAAELRNEATPSEPTDNVRVNTKVPDDNQLIVPNGQVPKSKFEALQQPPVQHAITISHRKLFADPGQWRIVWWGEFKEILARQLAHPERLRDSYRLPCYVQVIETEREVAIEELANAYKSDGKFQAPLYALTDEIAAKLDLVLPLRPAPPQHVRRPHNFLLPHERVFRLVAANDPTVDVSTIKNKSQSTPTNELETQNSDNAIARVGASLKKVIPDTYLKEWEFRISREEAAYDMNANPSLGARLRNLLRRIRVIKQRSAFRKWQTLTSGKSVDDQLWAVRPPDGMLVVSFFRDWARRTLELGGYDSQKMMGEWEIFWRRKGV